MVFILFTGAQDVPARRHRRQLQPAAGPQLEAEMGGEHRGDSFAAEEAGVPLQPRWQLACAPWPRLRAPGTVLLLGVAVMVLVSILEVDVTVR